MDVLAIAELSQSVGIIESLARLRHIAPSPSAQPKIEVFTSLPATGIGAFLTSENGRWSLLSLRTQPEVHLAFVHLESKVHASKEDQMTLATHEVRSLEKALASGQQECTLAERRLVIMGDFNMHPYDPGMSSFGAFDAMPTQDRVRKAKRIMSGHTSGMLYNPMWSFLGDLSPQSPGTHYSVLSRAHDPGWAMFDQILLSPMLLDGIDSTSVKIVSELPSSATPLYGKDGRPGGVHGSDHFPVLLRLDLSKVLH